MINSIFDKNTCFAGGGGAIFITNANADIANSSFTLNAIGSDSGGALYFTKSMLKFIIPHSLKTLQVLVEVQ